MEGEGFLEATLELVLEGWGGIGQAALRRGWRQRGQVWARLGDSDHPGLMRLMGAMVASRDRMGFALRSLYQWMYPPKLLESSALSVVI